MRFFKRTFDLLIGGIVLVVSLVFWPVIALAIKIDSKGPVFYIQKRVGKKGKVFSLIKFRSMVQSAEENGAMWAHENDKRITSVGRVLRRLHVDELPQLLNVLKGDMSLIGPRPERPEFVQVLNKEIQSFGERHQVKPGITGWAQVNHPYAASLEDSRKKLSYDLYYIKNRSLFFDLKILVLTAKRLVKGK